RPTGGTQPGDRRANRRQSHFKKNFGAVVLTAELRHAVQQELASDARLRCTRVLQALGVACSSWYRQPVPEEQRRRPGPAPQPIPEAVRQAVLDMAKSNPWYGYKRIAAMCRRAGQAVRDRQAYAVMRE